MRDRRREARVVLGIVFDRRDGILIRCKNKCFEATDAVKTWGMNPSPYLAMTVENIAGYRVCLWVHEWRG